MGRMRARSSGYGRRAPKIWRQARVRVGPCLGFPPVQDTSILCQFGSIPDRSQKGKTHESLELAPRAPNGPPVRGCCGDRSRVYHRVYARECSLREPDILTLPYRWQCFSMGPFWGFSWRNLRFYTTTNPRLWPEINPRPTPP